MKKLFVILSILLLLCSCSNKTEVNYTYEIKSSEVDMSGYNGVSSINHCFRYILPSEFFNAYDAKSSGVFYLGYLDCPFCQQFVKYLNQICLDNDITVYYMDAYNGVEKFNKGDYTYERMLEILYDYTDVDEETNEKCLWTPTIFALVNGEIKGFQIGAPYDIKGNLDWTFDNPSDTQIKHLTDTYKKIIKPFKK